MLLFLCKSFGACKGPYVQQPDSMGGAELSQRYSDHGMMRCLRIVHDEADVHALTNSLSAYRLQPARPLSTLSLAAIFTFLASSASRRCRARSIFAIRCI